MIKMFSIVAMFAISLPAIAKESKYKQGCDVLPRPENVVSVPEYSPEHSPPSSKEQLCCDGDAQNENKLQYEPTNDDVPIFEGLESQKEFAGGAFYPRAEELYISPEPDFVSTREPILDVSESESGSEKAALAEPSASAGQ